MENYFKNTASWICDIVVILILIIFGLIALKKGFFKCLLGFIGTIASIVLAYLFCKTLMQYFESWWGWVSKLTAFFEDKFAAIPGFNQSITSDLNESLNAANVPGFIISIIVKAFADTPIPDGTTVAQLVAAPAANLLIMLASFLIIFLLVKAVCLLLAHTLGDLFNRLPVVGGINRFLGFILGIVEGLILVYALTTVMSILPFEPIHNMVSNSIVTKFFTDYNLLGVIFKWAMSTDFLRQIFNI